MPSLAVVEDVNVLGDLALSLVTGFIAAMMHQFILERAPETLHRRVVIAVPPARHRGAQAELLQPGLVGMRAILGSAIGVMEEPRSWAFRADRHRQGPHPQVRGDAWTHRMADHLACVEILDPRQI